MTAVVERTRLWRRAASIAGASSPAARRYARGANVAWSYEALARGPDWLTWPLDRLERFARLVGAVAVARAWREGIDGEPLQRAALAIGAPMLERVLDLPDAGLPRLDPQPAECGDVKELAGLGVALLLSCAPLATCHVARLRSLDLPAAPQQGPEQARLALRSALALLAPAEGAA